MELFGAKSFAMLFVVLLAVPALPLPTGGATHVFELVAAVLAAQLIIGRREVWLPARWRRRSLAGAGQRRMLERLLRLVRALERVSRPRLAPAFRVPAARRVFGLLVLAGSLAALLAPPFTGLDTLPALAVVVLSLAVVLEDAVLVVVALTIGAAGVTLEIVVGRAVLDGLLRVL